MSVFWIHPGSPAEDCICTQNPHEVPEYTKIAAAVSRSINLMASKEPSFPIRWRPVLEDTMHIPYLGGWSRWLGGPPWACACGSGGVGVGVAAELGYRGEP